MRLCLTLILAVVASAECPERLVAPQTPAAWNQFKLPAAPAIPALLAVYAEHCPCGQGIWLADGPVFLNDAEEPVVLHAHPTFRGEEDETFIMVVPKDVDDLIGGYQLCLPVFDGATDREVLEIILGSVGVTFVDVIPETWMAQ